MRFFFIFRTVDVAIQKGFLRYTVSAFKDPLLAISNLFTPLPFCKEFLNIITEGLYNSLASPRPLIAAKTPFPPLGS